MAIQKTKKQTIIQIPPVKFKEREHVEEQEFLTISRAMRAWLDPKNANASDNDVTGFLSTMMGSKKIPWEQKAKYLTDLEHLNLRTHLGNTLLCLAAAAGDLPLCQWMVENGARVNFKSKANSTPLLEALKNNHEACIRFLLRKGASVIGEDMNGDTALHFVARRGSAALVKSLIRRGKLDINHANKDGDTPAHMVSRFRNFDVMAEFKRQGADFSKKNNEGKEPFDLQRSTEERSAMEKFLLTIELMSSSKAPSQTRSKKKGAIDHEEAQAKQTKKLRI